MSAASVLLDAGRVSVSMTVSAVERTRLVSDLPAFGFMGGQETYPDRQFPELAVSVDGHAVELGGSFKAMAGPTDVSALIRQAALDPYVVAHTPPLLPQAGTAAPQIKLLERAHAVQTTADGLMAHWTVARSVSLRLPNGPATQMIFRYDGRPALGLLTEQLSKLALRDLCMTSEMLQQAIGHPIRSRPYAFRIYAIPAGIDGHAPHIATVHIGAPDQQEHKRVLTAYCGSTGAAVVTQNGGSAAPARTDAGGVVHILSISDESLPP